MYEIHTDSTSPALLSQVNQFIHNRYQSNFFGTWMLVAEWNDVTEWNDVSEYDSSGSSGSSGGQVSTVDPSSGIIPIMDFLI